MIVATLLLGRRFHLNSVITLGKIIGNNLALNKHKQLKYKTIRSMIIILTH